MDHIDEKYISMLFPTAIKSGSKYKMRCPICGDSKVSLKKMRFWFFENKKGGTSTHCFNCDYSASFYSFLKEQNQSYFSLYTKEKSAKSFNSLYESLDTMVFDALPVVDEPIEIPEFDDLPQEAIQYLKDRKVYNEILRRKIVVKYVKEKEIFDMYLKDYIVFPLLTSTNEMFGFQARSLSTKKFFTKIFDKNKYNKIWNIYQCKDTEKIYAFESIFDALSSGIDNSIAMLGIGSESCSIPTNIVYCLDNQNVDDTAKINARAYAKANCEVFVWPKNIQAKDCNELLTKFGYNVQDIKELIQKNCFSSLEATIKLI